MNAVNGIIPSPQPFRGNPSYALPAYPTYLTAIPAKSTQNSEWHKVGVECLKNFEVYLKGENGQEAKDG
jgi:hypothetical protein